MRGHSRIGRRRQTATTSRIYRGVCTFLLFCLSDFGNRTYIRVYYGPYTSEDQLQHPQSTSLTVPPLDKNFLISPPGSPPVGWEQIKEDPPNTETLAADLMSALQDLQLGQNTPKEHSQPSSVRETTPQNSRPSSPTNEPVPHQADTLIIPSPDDASFPAVLVSDTDTATTNTNGLTISNTPHGIRRSPTPRPDISQVKATVESMRPSSITPTARPPICKLSAFSSLLDILLA